MSCANLKGKSEYGLQVFYSFKLPGGAGRAHHPAPSFCYWYRLVNEYNNVTRIRSVKPKVKRKGTDRRHRTHLSGDSMHCAANHFDSTRGFPGEGPRGGPGQVKLTYLTSSNVTAWSSARKALDNKSPPRANFLLLQEHKLSTTKAIEIAKKYLSKLGYESHFGAARTTSKKGVSAGTALAWKSGIRVRHIFDTRSYAPPERFTAICTDLANQNTIVGTYYGDVDSETNNLSLLGAIAQNLVSSRIPLILGGDFNLDAQTMAGWMAVRFPHLKIVEAGPTCCTGKMIKATTLDYFIVSKSLLPLLGSIQTEDTTIKTHKPVSLAIKATDKLRLLTKYDYPKPGHEAVTGPKVHVSSWWEEAEETIRRIHGKFVGDDGAPRWATEEEARDPAVWAQVTQSTRVWHTAAEKELEANCRHEQETLDMELEPKIYKQSAHEAMLQQRDKKWHKTHWWQFLHRRITEAQAAKEQDRWPPGVGSWRAWAQKLIASWTACREGSSLRTGRPTQV